MDEITAFRLREQNIYEKIRKEETIAKLQGLLPDSALLKGLGGLGLVIRHDRKPAKQVADLARRISRTVPSYGYSASVIHASVLNKLSLNFRYQPDRDDAGLQLIASAVASFGEEQMSLWRREAEVEMGQPLFNQTTVILPGEPNDPYIEMLYSLAERCRAAIPEIEITWGSHITVARMTAPSPPSQAGELAKLLEQCEPPGKLSPRSLDVVWGEARRDSFRQKTWHRFKLGNGES